MTARKWVFRDTIDVEATPVREHPRQPRKRARSRAAKVIIADMTIGACIEFFLAFQAIRLAGVPEGLATSALLSAFGAIMIMIGMKWLTAK